MTPTPTAPDRRVHLDGFATLTDALDFAAEGPTGVNLYGLRGELIAAVPYGELRARARAMAARLLAAGLAPHDRVGLVADTDLDFVVAFFACQYARLTPAPLPLPTALGGRDAYVEQITRMLSSAQATAAGVAILAGGTIRDLVSQIVDAGLFGPLHDVSLGYTVVYHLEIALLFLTLAALGPLVRIGTLTQPDQGQPGLRLTEFPT